MAKVLNTHLAGFAKSFLTSNFRDFGQRFKSVLGKQKDPYDTFNYLLATCKKYAVKTKFFFLVGNTSSLDKNVSHAHPGFRQIIKTVSDKSDIGVHLSFMSHISNEEMEEEIHRLEYISGLKITSNRFNYLRFTLPASFVSLNRIGITDDYSMGYATRTGFRAATCTPFYFFNLLKNERTALKLHPFAFMDTTLARYNKVSAQEALEKIIRMMKWVKEVEGPFIGIWHNSSFTEEDIWEGWQSVFETVAREAAAISEKSE